MSREERELKSVEYLVKKIRIAEEDKKNDEEEKNRKNEKVKQNKDFF